MVALPSLIYPYTYTEPLYPYTHTEPRNPYKGLHAFTSDDAGDFFGRGA